MFDRFVPSRSTLGRSLPAIGLVWMLVLLSAAPHVMAEGSDQAARDALAARIPAEILGVPVESSPSDAAWLFEGSEARPGRSRSSRR